VNGVNVGTPYSPAAKTAALAAIGGDSFPGTIPELLQQVVIASNANSGGGSGTSNVNITGIDLGEYETVAASQTAQTLGTSGAAGDYIAGLLVIPATTSPGNVLLLDNATSITVFTGGSSSVSNLVPFFIPLGIKSVNGAWKVTTGANVSVIASGNFS
jgi:hypothetical protein